jgi:hypothetical protein
LGARKALLGGRPEDGGGHQAAAGDRLELGLEQVHAAVLHEGDAEERLVGAVEDAAERRKRAVDGFDGDGVRHHALRLCGAVDGGFVPGQQLGVRLGGWVGGELDLTAVELVVDAAVVVVLAQLTAHREAQVRTHRHVAEVEQSVQAAAQRQPAGHHVGTAGRPGPDVRRVDDRQRLLGRDRASLPVRVEHRESEAGLTEAREDQLRTAGALAVKGL